MQQGWLPLFPLQVVLLPGGQLPLHIFEDRYKEMIGEALREKTEFGVILANQSGIAETGCTAVIEAVLKEYPDGRLDILTRGKRRFEVLLVNQEKNYLRGSVEFFDDDDGQEAGQEAGGSAVSADPGIEAVRAEAIASYNLIQQMRAGEPLDPASADPQISFQLARTVDDLVLRQSLLMSRSELERLKKLADFLPTLTSQQNQIQKIRDVAKLNGHGHQNVENN